MGLPGHPFHNLTRLRAVIPWLRDACLKADAWLTPQRVHFYPLLTLFITYGSYLISIALGAPPFDSFGNPYAVDLTAHVTAGRIALNGDLHRLYDLDYQREVQQNLLGAPPGFLDVYLSPPFVAYLYAPLAALPYIPAAAIWTALTVALLLLSFYLLWPLVPNLRRFGYPFLLLLMFSSWPVFELLGDGQDSAVSLLLFVAGLRLLLARRDLAAGCLLGLGVFKPQLFLLLPVLLLLQRRWRALAAFLAVASALTALSIAIVGVEGARSFMELLTSDTYTTLIAQRLGWKMQSLTALARSFFPGPSAFLVGPVAIAGVVVSLALLARNALKVGNDKRFVLLYALGALLVALANPHLFLYDCVVFLLPAFILFNEAPTSPTVRLSLAAVYVLTLTAALRNIIFWQTPWPLTAIGAPWTVLPIVGLIVVALRLLGGGSREKGEEKRGRCRAQPRPPTPGPWPLTPTLLLAAYSPGSPPGHTAPVYPPRCTRPARD